MLANVGKEKPTDHYFRLKGGVNTDFEGALKSTYLRGEWEPVSTANFINAPYPWLDIECSRCKSKRDVDLAALRHPPTTFVHDLASRLRCSKCAEADRRPAATLLQLASRRSHADSGI